MSPVEFAHPGLAWLALFVPAVFYLRVARKSRAVPMPGLSAMKGLPKSRIRRLPLFLMALACILLVAAAARPRSRVEVVETKLMGVDVALALDVSASMRAEDFPPSRMEAAKKRTREFIEGFRDGRLALVAFAGRSFTQCPLTTDGGILVELLDQLDVGSVAIDGTAIGDAVLNAVNRFTDDSGSRIIILLTDGENNSGTADPIAAARVARDKGIRLYAIGVGTPGGAPIPAYGPGGQRFYLTDPYGNPVLTKLDEKTLTWMAEITGGAYFRAEDERGLSAIYKKIAEMEKKEIKLRRAGRYRELGMYPACMGMILLIAGAALGSGRLRVLS